MKPRELKPGIHSVGAVDWDRRLFDSLIPLPDGTSYNAYLVKGKTKTALVDTVDPPMADVLFDNLAALGVKKLDYVIAHHGEQDHSGSIPAVLARYPEAVVLCSPKCKGMLTDLLLVPEEKITAVEDGDTVALGGRTLTFIHTPWVHWPETMVTWLEEDRVLFSCDFFGAHLAQSALGVADEALLHEAAKRYFAEIMMPFRNIIVKDIEKVQDLGMEIIAPSHGPVHFRPQFILDAYHEWVSGPPKNTVVIPYVSMHGSTKKMVDYFTGALTARGVTVKRFDLTVTDIGKLAMELVDAATVVIGTPTVLAGAHPLAAYAAFLANALRPDIKFISVIGSYGWGGKTVDQLAGMIPSLKAEVLQPVLSKGYPVAEDFKALDALADAIAEKHESAHWS